ncbi:MAG TPA: hypothetical protein VE844_04135, partial [Gammaproteobacteria bacterium]|nr:hypothetical protein [Gammaproteobacteria bacterium]
EWHRISAGREAPGLTPMFIGTCAKFVYLATASRDDNAPNVIKVLNSKFFTTYLLRLTNPDLIGIKRRT